MYDGFTYFAWVVLALLFLVVVVLIVFLGSQPKKIAMRRNHPQVDAINACSWIGLLLGGVGWPIALVWAFLKSGPVGYESSDSGNASPETSSELKSEIHELRQRIEELKKQLETVQTKQAE